MDSSAKNLCSSQPTAVLTFVRRDDEAALCVIEHLLSSTVKSTHRAAHEGGQCPLYYRVYVKTVRWVCPSTSPPAAVTLRTNGENLQHASPVRAEPFDYAQDRPRGSDVEA